MHTEFFFYISVLVGILPMILDIMMDSQVLVGTVYSI